jgi:hypothetical protein
MTPFLRNPLPLLFALLAPLLAFAQDRYGGQGLPSPGNPGGTQASPFWYFGVAVIAAIILLWTVRILRKRGGPPPIDPTLRGPGNASR